MLQRLWTRQRREQQGHQREQRLRGIANRIFANERQSDVGVTRVGIGSRLADGLVALVVADHFVHVEIPDQVVLVVGAPLETTHGIHDVADRIGGHPGGGDEPIGIRGERLGRPRGPSQQVHAEAAADRGVAERHYVAHDPWREHHRKTEHEQTQALQASLLWRSHRQHQADGQHEARRDHANECGQPQPDPAGQKVAPALVGLCAQCEYKARHQQECKRHFGQQPVGIVRHF